MEENKINVEEEVKEAPQKYPIVCENDGVTVLGESTIENAKGYWCGNCFEKRELEAALERKENFTNHNLSTGEVKEIVDRVALKSPEIFIDYTFDQRVMLHAETNQKVIEAKEEKEALAADGGVAVDEVHGN